MITFVEYGIISGDFLTITFACENMTVKINCTPSEFAELRDKVEVSFKRPMERIG